MKFFKKSVKLYITKYRLEEIIREEIEKAKKYAFPNKNLNENEKIEEN